MNNCPEFVQQATEGGFPWILLLLVAAIVGGVYIWRNGIVGTEASLKSLAEKLKVKAEKVEAKWRAKQAAAPAPAPTKTKAERIAEAKTLLGDGDAFNQAAAKIAAEP